MEIEFDQQDTSSTPLAAMSMLVVPQTNGVIRIHGHNGAYLFSLVRTSDGVVHAFQNGFGRITAPQPVYAGNHLIQPSPVQP